MGRGHYRGQGNIQNYESEPGKPEVLKVYAIVSKITKRSRIISRRKKATQMA